MLTAASAAKISCFTRVVAKIITLLIYRQEEVIVLSDSDNVSNENESYAEVSLDAPVIISSSANELTDDDLSESPVKVKQLK